MLETETVFDLAEAARRLPAFGTGKKKRRPHVSTLWRWARRGVMGRRLEVRRLGRRIVTSMEALDRFAKSLADIELPQRAPHASAPKVRGEAARKEAIKRAEEQLRRAGI